jgi:hypothetical protein
MAKLLTILLTCLAVVICPMNCSGQIAMVLGHDESLVAGCPCCQPPVDSEAPTTPDGDDCPCSNCLCDHGAVLNEGDLSLEIPESMLSIAFERLDLLHGGTLTSVSTFFSIPDTSPRVSGRVLRLAICSLLN